MAPMTRPASLRPLATALVAALATAPLLAAPPARVAEASAKLLSETGGTVDHSVGRDDGIVRRLRYAIGRTPRGLPEERAREFLVRHHRAFGLPPGEPVVSQERLHDSPAGRHVRFRQLVGGLPVYGADLVVGMDAGGSVREVASESRPELRLATAPARLDAREAIRRARRRVGVRGSLRGTVTTEAVAFPFGDEARTAWVVGIPAIDPLGDWEVVIDAADGAALSVRNRIQRASGVGQIIDPNPVVALRNTALRDNNDDPAAVPSNAYSAVGLLGLDGSGFLRGDFVDAFSQLVDSAGNPVVDGSGNPATVTRAREPSLQFFYDRGDERFEEVQAYFHIDRLQRYIQEQLGFPDAMNRQIAVNVHAFADDNSFYSPNTRGLTFGSGGSDDAEDADVLLHEYGHAVHDDQIPGFGTSHEARAMGEGFADSLAVLFLSALGQNFNTPVVADWDATSYSLANPPNLRRVDGTKIYPGALVQQVHKDGEIWSGALYLIRNRLGGAGGGDRTVLQTLLQGHYSLVPSSGFRDAANAMLAADAALNNGANIQVMRAAFVERGILSDTAAPVIGGVTPRSSLNLASTAVTITGFGFSGATRVFLTGNGTRDVASFTVIDDGRIDAIVPASLPSASYVINVTTSRGTGSGPGRFHVDDRPDAPTAIGIADRLAANVELTGLIGDGQDVDWYSFPARAGGPYELRTLSSTNLDTVLTLFDRDGTTELAENDDANHPDDLTSRIASFQPAVSGTYFLRVRGYDGRITGSYSVRVSGPGGVDLLPVRLGFPTRVTGGSTLTVTAEVQNAADQFAPPFGLDVSLLSAGQPVVDLWSTTVSAGLSARSVIAVSSGSLGLPPLLAPGSYQLRLRIDPAGGISEIDETNNQRVEAATVAIDPPAAMISFDLALDASLALVGLPLRPFTRTGAPYTAANLAADLDANLVGRLVGPDGGAPRFAAYLPGTGSPDFELRGARAYLVTLKKPKTVTLSGLPWPEGTQQVSLAQGYNDISYPFGVPAGETAQGLIDRTGAQLFVGTQDGSLPGVRFKTVVSGAAKAPPSLRPGRGYLLHIPRVPEPPVLTLPGP